MTTARQIIEGALGFRLNKLSPGETLDADTGATCLTALNELADEMNGGGSFLFREILSVGTVTSAIGTIGTTWASLSPGVRVLGATYDDGSGAVELSPLTMAQYAIIADKTTPGEPHSFAPDGYASVYFYPVPTSVDITLRTKQTVSEFADLETDYGMPKGYRTHLSALLAEKLAPSLVGGVSPDVARGARLARQALLAQNMNPAIMQGSFQRPSILEG
jgi:hypothetical protein